MTMLAAPVPPGMDEAWPRRWILAGAVVVAVHAALLYWLISTRTIFAPDGPPPAAIMIDLAPLPEEAPLEMPAEAPPEVVEPEPEPEPEETVVIPEPPQAKRPDAVLLAQPKPPVPKKKVEKPVPKREPRQPAPRAAAKSSNAATARAAAGAPSPGASATSGASSASWHSLVAAHIRRHKPGGAQERGTCVVSFTVDRGGRVLGARVSASSGSAALDRAALAMIHNSNPVPAPPADVAGSRFPFSVPVNFR